MAKSVAGSWLLYLKFRLLPRDGPGEDGNLIWY